MNCKITQLHKRAVLLFAICKSVLLGSLNFLGIIYKHQKREFFPPTTIDEIHWKQVVHKPNQHLTQPTAQNDWLTSLPIFVLTNPAAAALLHKGSLGAGNWIEGQGFGWLSQSCTVGWTSNSKINILLILFTQQVCQIVWKCDMSVGKRFLRDEELI